MPNKALPLVLLLAGIALLGPSCLAAGAENGSGTSAVTTTSQLTGPVCDQIVKHTPDANVAYQPGVDVHGNAVAPADLPGSPQIEMPKTFQIPLTIGLAKTLNFNTSSYPYNQLGPDTEAIIGTLTVTGDHVLFNGQPISDEQQSNLSVLCLKANK